MTTVTPYIVRHQMRVVSSSDLLELSVPADGGMILFDYFDIALESLPGEALRGGVLSLVVMTGKAISGSGGSLVRPLPVYYPSPEMPGGCEVANTTKAFGTDWVNWSRYALTGESGFSPLDPIKVQRGERLVLRLEGCPVDPLAIVLTAKFRYVDPIGANDGVAAGFGRAAS